MEIKYTFCIRLSGEIHILPIFQHIIEKPTKDYNYRRIKFLCFIVEIGKRQHLIRYI